MLQWSYRSEFDRHLGSAATDVSASFRASGKVQTGILRLLDTWRNFMLRPLSEKRPWIWCSKLLSVHKGLLERCDTMMTSSNGNIFRVTGPLCGEFTGPGEFPTQRPVTRSFDVYFDLRLNKRLSKQSRGWWFETLSRSLWRHRNALNAILSALYNVFVQHHSKTRY